VVVEDHRSGTLLPVRSEGQFRLATEPISSIPLNYGIALGKGLFNDSIRDAFVRARNESADSARVLLFVEAEELKSWRWEWLCGPVDGNRWDFLSLDQRALFSLYLPSLTDRAYPPIGRADLRALVVVASPADPEKRYGLEPFDVVSHVARLQAIFGEQIPSEVLARVPGAAGGPTVDELITRLTEGAYPILHVLCHGRFNSNNGETVLFLEQATADGRGTVALAQPVSGTELVKRLTPLKRLPYLVFLSACESSAPEAEQRLGGLAQRLVRDLGIPAVIGMTEKVSVRTAHALAAAFYQRLLQQKKLGEVDRALVEAYAGLASRPDVNVPALYSRLGSQPLFSRAADRALTGLEIGLGLEKLDKLLTERAPVLRQKFENSAQKLQPTLDNDPDALSATAKQEREQSLTELNELCQEAVEVSFNALAQGEPAPGYDARQPFRGMSPFRVEDREFFSGREALVAKLERKLAEDHFLPVLGPSGSGKSSLVLAGLVPRLKQKESGLQVVDDLKPGTAPMQQLQARQGKLAPGAVLYIVDQFEEVFTLCKDEAQRQQFIDELLKLTETERVVLTMRADFWGECARYEKLKERMQSRQELVGAMNASELRKAMELQAAKVGLRFEADLSNTMLDEVAGEPGAMPLLQHALLELWKRRHGRWLRAEEYRQLDGVKKAIAETADRLYGEFAAAEQERVRDIFLRLTQLDESVVLAEQRRDTRRRVSIPDLVPAGTDVNETKALLKKLADAVLVVTSRNEVTGQEEVEVAHEALIQYWPLLHSWLERGRDALRLREAVWRAAHDWDASVHDPSYLIHRGRRLEEAAVLLSHARKGDGISVPTLLGLDLGLAETFQISVEKVSLNARELAYLDACVGQERQQGRLTILVEGARDRGGITIHLYHRGEAEGYTTALRGEVVRVEVVIDLVDLRVLEGDHVAYGRLLCQKCFSHSPWKELFNKLLDASGSRPQLRLLIDSRWPALHDFSWEALCHPATGTFIADTASIIRLTYSDCARLLPRGLMRSLVVAAGVRNTAPLVDRAARRLGYPTANIDIIQQSSLTALSSRLATGYDFVYLIARAEMSGGEPALRLADGSGGWTWVKWPDLTAALSQWPPRLIVLENIPEKPNDGGRMDAGALMSIASRFAEAGVLAVLVVTALLDEAAADTAIAIFFREVYQHGSTGRAMVAANSSLREQPHFWPLTLYKSTDEDALWYVPGFQGAIADKRWAMIRTAIERSHATPILGPEVAERYTGSQRDFANELAQGIGLEPQGLDVETIFQHATIYESRNYLHSQFAERIRSKLNSRFAPHLSPLKQGSLAEIVAEAYRLECKHDALEPHHILASLPLPIYITATPFNLIAIALREIGRDPIELYNLTASDSIERVLLDTDVHPTIERPLVYHLFGNVAIPDSLVLAEDDFLNQFTSWATNRNLIPYSITGALVDTMLLLIGHREDERSFQFLLRMLLSSPGSDRTLRFSHIMQCTPQVSRQADRPSSDWAERLHRLSLTVYSGNPVHFLNELQSRFISPIDSIPKAEEHDKKAPTAEPSEEHQLSKISGWNFHSNLAAPNPYAGPRPLQAEDSIYGRDAQISKVLSLILSERIVVLYGKAGVGKTSMVNAGLVQQLEAKGLAVYRGIRLTLAPLTGEVSTNSNPYVWSVLAALCQSVPSEKRLAMEELERLTLVDGLDHLLPADKRAILIFDKFEEIVSLDPNDDSRRGEFFRQLGIVLRDHRYYGLFVVREDYLGSIQPFARLLPTGLGSQFRLMPLNSEEAFAAIQEPARRQGVDFSPSAVQILVDGLRRAAIQNQDGTKGSVMSTYIDPFALQIFCRQLWDQLPPDVRTIDENAVGSIEHLGSALARYYAYGIERSSQLAGVSEQVLRNWFDRELITNNGFRPEIAQETIEGQGIPKSVLDTLVASYLLRAELRNGTMWFQLAGDLLVDAVRSNNAGWFAAQLSTVEKEARRWEQQGRPDSLLLQGSALTEAEDWVSSHPESSPFVREFLAISRGIKPSNRRWWPRQ
jgi:energy-coupling factor transporter ATP-binding protein EcfA2